MRVIPLAVEERKKDKKPTKKLKVPDWEQLVGKFDDKAIAAAVQKATALPGALSDDNYVMSAFPVLPRSLTAADLDFGTVKESEVKLSDLIASQNWIRRDRLIWHVQHPGKRNDNGSPFVSMPLIAADSIIVDGHHALTALLLLGADKVPVWGVPIGLATGHPR